MESTSAIYTGVSDLVRNYFEAYRFKDRGAIEELLGDDFTFRSPFDECIGRQAYFEHCWPSSERVRAHTIERLLENGGEACVLYELELLSGAKFRNTEHFKCAGGKIREVEVYFGSLPTGAPPESDAAEIRELIADRVRAVQGKNVDGAMARVALDILSFDVVNPLQNAGLAGSRARAEAWFSSFRGPIGFELRDLRVVVGGDVAFSHSLNRYSGTKTDGAKLDMWVRATGCYRKIGGSWILTHEHDSVPFDAETGKASLALQP